MSEYPPEPPQDDVPPEPETATDTERRLVGRTPPNDELAEQSALSAAMQTEKATEQVLGILRPGDFYRPKHETIFGAIAALSEAGEPVDGSTVHSWLLNAGELAGVGGPAYLHTVVSAAPTAANASFYARTVRDHAAHRRLIEAGTRAVELGYAGGDPSANLAAAQTDILGLDAPGATTGRLIGEIAAQVIEDVEDGVATGNTMPTGYGREAPELGAGQLIVVAGRPAMGKSVCVLDMARHVAIREGFPVVMFTLEMSCAEIGARAIAAEVGIPLPHLQPGQMNDDDWRRWARKNGGLLDAPLWVDDNPHANPAYIRSEARRLQRERGGLGLVVVDYMQLMTSGKRVESRQQEVSGFSRSLKLLAKELEVPVIAVSQLNRGPEGRHDKKPMMSDLRESGGLEQDADQVVLVFREDAYEPESPRAGEVDLIWAKNRSGPTTTVTLAAQLSRSRFVPMAQEPWTPHRAADQLGQAS